MGTNDSSNIFDDPEKKKESSTPILGDQDIQEMFDKMIEMRQELDKKTDELKDAIALTKQDINAFFSNSKNFTPEQWSIIQQNRTELEQKAFMIVGKDPNKVRQKQLESKETKARKGKTLGSRRNWIPMR